MQKCLNLLLICCLSIPIQSKAQKDRDSSCEEMDQGDLFDSSAIGTLDLSRLMNMGLHNKNQEDFERAQQYFTRYLELAQELRDTIHIANALNLNGELLMIQGEFDLSLEFIEQGLVLREKMGDQVAVANSLKNIGMVYNKQGNLAQALSYLIPCVALSEKTKATQDLESVFRIIATIYQAQENYSQALQYIFRCLEIAEATGNTKGVASAYSVLGGIYMAMGEFSQALETYDCCIRLSEEEGLTLVNATALTGIGMTYQALGDLEQARSYLMQSLAIRQEFGLRFPIGVSVRALGNLALDQKDYVEAINYCQQGLEIANEIGSKSIQLNSLACLYEAYKSLKQPDQALAFWEQFYLLDDSLKMEETRLQLQKMEFTQERLTDSLINVRKQISLELAYQEKLSRRNYLIVGGITLGIVVFFFFRNRHQTRSREQELELQRERELKEQMTTLNQLKSRFFANISHELRTPLTLILGPLSHILDHPSAWDQEKILHQLRMMQRNGRKLTELIEEILDLSKLEANKLELLEETTPVKPFFEYLFAIFEPQFQSLDLQVDLRFDLKEDSLHVLMDRKKIEKVLNNYLSNAIKFTPKGGPITLTISETDSRLLIEVSDTGVGVHPQDLPHVFERFYQSMRAEQKVYGGTGIGLALVSEFAALMGGKAYAESQPGQGSQFYFEWPINKVPAQQLLSEGNSEWIDEDLIYSIGTDFTLLVVEDNQDMREFICQVFVNRYRVLQARNGAEGLALLQEHGTEIHLVLSDVMMPEVDGLSLLKQIKSHRDWAGIPVIMLTALATERDKLTALTIGVDDYLTKPFSVSELLARVQNLLYNYLQRRNWQNSPEYAAEKARLTAAEEPQHPAIDILWVQEREAQILESLSTGTFNVDQLAEASCLSKRQLTRKITALTGLSPGRFIREVQLQFARQKLEKGSSISVSEVAFEAGFEHLATFSKLFKKRFGKSPSEYFKT